MQTLNQLLERLQEIKEVAGGDVPVTGADEISTEAHKGKITQINLYPLEEEEFDYLEDDGFYIDDDFYDADDVLDVYGDL